MNIKRMFAYAVVRKVAYMAVAAVVALLASLLGTGQARAYDLTSCDATSDQCTPETSYNVCLANITEYANAASPPHTNPRCTTTNDPATQSAGQWYGYADRNSDGAKISFGTTIWGISCVAPSVWDEPTKTCHNEQRCLDKPAMGGGVITANSTSACIDGCAYGPGVAGDGTTLSFNGSAFVSITKGWKPTGKACSDADFDQEKQECLQLDHGQTACARPDGKHCYSGASGPDMSMCWAPGETGEKTNGPDMQKTNAGPDAIPPANLTLPSGDTFQPVGNPTTTNISNTTNGNTTNTTTTTNNFQTVNGTNAGSGGAGDDAGEPTDGSAPKGDGKDGDGECTTALCKELHGLRGDLGGGGTGGAGDDGPDPLSVWGDGAADELTPDAGGYLGGGSCPAGPVVFGKQIDVSAFCSLAGIVAAMVLLMGSAHFIYAFTR